MEIIIIIGAAALLFFVALLPSWLMWLLAAKFLPIAYVMPPNKMTACCVLLAFVTGLLLNVELEAGALSIPVFIAVVSVLWSLLLIPLCIFVKCILKIKQK